MLCSYYALQAFKYAFDLRSDLSVQMLSYQELMPRIENDILFNLVRWKTCKENSTQ